MRNRAKEKAEQRANMKLFKLVITVLGEKVVFEDVNADEYSMVVMLNDLGVEFKQFKEVGMEKFEVRACVPWGDDVRVIDSDVGLLTLFAEYDRRKISEVSLSMHRIDVDGEGRNVEAQPSLTQPPNPIPELHLPSLHEAPHTQSQEEEHEIVSRFASSDDDDDDYASSDDSFDEEEPLEDVDGDDIHFGDFDSFESGDDLDIGNEHGVIE